MGAYGVSGGDTHFDPPLVFDLYEADGQRRGAGGGRAAVLHHDEEVQIHVFVRDVLQAAGPVGPLVTGVGCDQGVTQARSHHVESDLPNVARRCGGVDRRSGITAGPAAALAVEAAVGHYGAAVLVGEPVEPVDGEGARAAGWPGGHGERHGEARHGSDGEAPGDASRASDRRQSHELTHIRCGKRVGRRKCHGHAGGAVDRVRQARADQVSQLKPESLVRNALRQGGLVARQQRPTEREVGAQHGLRVRRRACRDE